MGEEGVLGKVCGGDGVDGGAHAATCSKKVGEETSTGGEEGVREGEVGYIA